MQGYRGLDGRPKVYAGILQGLQALWGLGMKFRVHGCSVWGFFLALWKSSGIWLRA